MKIRNASLTYKFNKRTRQREEEVENDRFLENYAEKAILGWKGLKVKHMPALMPVDISGMDANENIDCYSTFSLEAQQALLMMNALPDLWEGMNGVWLGKNYNGLFDILKLYKIDNKREVFELLKVCEEELSKYYSQKRKEQDQLSKAKSKRGKISGGFN